MKDFPYLIFQKKSRRFFKMKIKNNSRSGMYLVECMIIVAILGFLAVIAIPNFVQARQHSQLNKIVCNLRIIEGAKDQWALDHKMNHGINPTPKDLAPYMKDKICPPETVVGETYNINAVYSAEATAKLPENVKLGKYPRGGTVVILSSSK